VSDLAPGVAPALWGMAALGVLVLAYSIIWTVRWEPLYRCRNCRQWVGRRHPGDPRWKAELRRDHEKVCLS